MLHRQTNTITHILNRLSDGAFHSGQKLADELQISRTAIWKTIRTLQQQGLAIDVVPRRGYRIARGLSLLNLEALFSYLQPSVQSVIRQVDLFPCLPSTNQYLLDNTHLPSGSLCLAEQQTKGRGRMGRSWFSPFAASIYASILWHFDSNLSQLSGLSLAIGIACARALKEYGIVGIQLKWPNDLVIDGRKLGGILLEISGALQSQCAMVIGIGINCKLPPTAQHHIDQPITDLETTLSQPISRNQILGCLLNAVIPTLQTFSEQGLSHYLTEWQTLDMLYGKSITLSTATGNILGEARGIDATGNLQVKTQAGYIRSFNSGEVKVSV